MKPDRNSRQS